MVCGHLTPALVPFDGAAGTSAKASSNAFSTLEKPCFELTAHTSLEGITVWLCRLNAYKRLVVPALGKPAITKDNLGVLLLAPRGGGSIGALLSFVVADKVRRQEDSMAAKKKRSVRERVIAAIE